MLLTELSVVWLRRSFELCNVTCLGNGFKIESKLAESDEFGLDWPGIRLHILHDKRLVNFLRMGDVASI